MTQEEFDVKKLEQFALQNNIPFYSCFNKQHSLPKLARRYIAARYVIYDLSKVSKGLYFLFYCSSTGGTRKSSGWGDTYCGLFKEIENFDYNVTIRERQWLDKLSFQKRYLTGNRNLDEGLSIFVDSKRINHAILREKNLRQFTSLMKRINPLKVETEIEAWNIIPELDQKTIISLRLNHWLTDSSKINWFIANGSKYLLEE